MVSFLRNRVDTGTFCAGGLNAVGRDFAGDSKGTSAEYMNSAALDKFFASVEKDAYRLAVSAVHDPDDAIDLVQDVMLTLVKNYRHKSEDEWRPLFFRILQNHIRDWFRRRSVKHTLLRWSGLGDTTEQIANIEAPESDNPEYTADSSESLASVEAAIQTLSYKQQQVFLLRSWQEWSVSDTARIMSISESSVKTHHARAITALREKLSSGFANVNEGINPSSGEIK